MYQTGTLDPVFTLPLRYPGYDQSPAPKYFVEFTAAARLADRPRVHGPRHIVDRTLAFFDRYVKGAVAATVRLTKLPGVGKFTHAER